MIPRSRYWKIIDDPSVSKVAKIPYLIDQQASHNLCIYLKRKESFQPIMVGEENGELLELSREQALALIRCLLDVMDEVPERTGIEYPGKVITIK